MTAIINKYADEFTYDECIITGVTPDANNINEMLDYFYGIECKEIARALDDKLASLL